MRRLNLPPAGELLAGVVRPRCSAFPSCKRTYFRKARLSPTCSVVSWLGAVLLIVTGLETDLNLIIRVRKPLCWISQGIVAPS